MRVSVVKRISISPWPPVATSWWWASTSMPSFSRRVPAGTGVLERVGRGHRGVALLRRDLSLRLGPLPLASVPVRLHAIRFRSSRNWSLVVMHAVEHEMLELGTDRPRRRPSTSQIGLRLLRDVARVPVIGTAGDRIGNAADQHQRRRLSERVEERRRRIGNGTSMSLSWIS